MEAEGQEKTEKPTAKRQREARKKGNVAKSQEVDNALFLIAALVLFLTSGSYIMDRIKVLVTDSLININYEVTAQNIPPLVVEYLMKMFVIFFPFALTMLVITFLSSYLQIGWLFSTSSLKLNWSSLFNIGKGFSQLFSLTKLKDLWKSLIKLIGLSIIAYLTVKKEIFSFLGLASLSPQLIYTYITKIVLKLLGNILIIYSVIAAADFALTKFLHTKKLKMSKSEVKDERRQMEGDPQVKRQIMNLMFQQSRKKMMEDVPKADVVITNPVHIAVALSYDSKGESAPIVVAKGKRLIAEEIKRIAREHNIPIFEDKPLARLLYKTTELGQEISVELYGAVAEILAEIYKLKNRKM